MSAQIIKQITALIHENRFDEAKSIIKRVAVEHNSDATLLCELGKLEFLMGEFSEAKNYLVSAITLNADNFEPHYQLGLVLLKEGAAGEAMPLFRQACELKPDFGLGHFYWGLSLYNTGHLAGALGQFRAAIKTDKSLFTAMYYSGLVNQSLNELEEARQDFNHTIAAEPDFAPAHNALGTTLLRLGKIPESILAFEKACKLKPDFAMAHFNLAIVLAISNQFEKAQKHYREALNNSEISAAQRGLIYNNLGIMLVQMQQWETAYEYLRQAKTIAPHLVEVHINLGLVQMALQEYDLAFDCFEQILVDFPGNSEASYYAGIALLCLHRFKEAQTKLITVINSNQQASFWLGWAYLADHDYPRAKTQFENIIASNQTDSKQALSFDALGLCFALSDQHDDAISHFNRSLKTDPSLALAYLHRARSHEALNENELAQKDYARALELDPDCFNADKDQIAQLLKDSKTEEALLHATKILSFQPQDLKSQLLLARTLKDKTDYTAALSLLSSIMAQAPENAETYAILGQIHMAQSNFAQADEIFAQGSQLSDVESELFLYWGKALNTLGLAELAMEKFKQAADINPYDPDIYENWGQTLKSLQRFDEASEVYKLASSYL